MGDEARQKELKSEIEIFEFGNLSKSDLALIAERMYILRHKIEPQFIRAGIEMVEDPVLNEIINFMATKNIINEPPNIGIDPEWHDQALKAIKDNRIDAFTRAKELIEDKNFEDVIEKIGKKDINVWFFLINLSEMNEAIKNTGRKEGIILIAQEPKILEEIFSKAGKGKNKAVNPLSVQRQNRKK